MKKFKLLVPLGIVIVCTTSLFAKSPNCFLNSKTQAKRRFLLLAIGALLTFSFCGKVSANTAYTGMRNITALQLTADMGTGWNLGNALDATCGETCWGNPTTTQAMIDKIKAQGFKTLRIPTTWGPHVGGAPNYTIDAAWLNRVETVCNYAFANDMYVILNTHHEGDWCKPTYADEAAVRAKLVAIWTQIANRFRDYGDYLIFETLNEPRLEGSAEEWTGGTAEGREVVNRLNKAAVDAIRATGGNNSSRFIMCPPYAAAGLGTPADAFVVPNNDSKVIVSVHNYSPYSFCLQEPGTSTFTSSDRSTLDSEMGSYYNRWINAGRAVVIGEWGSVDKNNTSERASHATYFVQAAKSRQLTLVLWDNGATGQGGMGHLNRAGLSWFFPTIVDAITSQFSGSCNPTSITPYVQVNGGSWQQTSSVTVNSGVQVKFGPQPTQGGSWSWSGPNGFSASTREVTISNIQANQAGNYVATYTNSGGCQSTQTFSITVTASCSPTAITPYVQINGGTWQQTATASLAPGGSVMFGPQPVTGGSWSWSGPNNFSATTREVIISNIQTNQAGNYIATYTNADGCSSTQTFSVTVTGSIVVRARGTQGDETIDLRVGGNTVATWTLTTSYANYTASGSGAVEVHFTNDNGSRDVQVDYVTINGTTYQSENQATNTGVWQNSTCGGSNSEWLNCNGYISYQSSSARIGTIESERMTEAENILSDVVIYPNPTSGKINISLPEIEGNSVVNIFDSKGRKVYEKTISGKGTPGVDLRLKTGIYLVKVTSQELNFTGKLIVR